MKSELITKLNEKVSEITIANINIHKEIGDISDWLEDWRCEMAVISLELFLRMRLNNGDDHK